MKRIIPVILALSLAVMAMCLTACGQDKYTGKAEEMMPTVVDDFERGSGGGYYVTPSDYHLVEVKENTGHGYENLVTATYENNTYRIVAQFMADNDGNLTYLDISNVEAIAPIDKINLRNSTTNPCGFADEDTLIADLPNTSVTFDEEAQTCVLTFDNAELARGTYGTAYIDGSYDFVIDKSSHKWVLADASHRIPASIDLNAQALEGTYVTGRSDVPPVVISDVHLNDDGIVACTVSLENDYVAFTTTVNHVYLEDYMTGFSIYASSPRHFQAKDKIGYEVKIDVSVNDPDSDGVHDNYVKINPASYVFGISGRYALDATGLTFTKQ